MSGPEDIDNEPVGFDSIEEALAARVPSKTCEHCKNWRPIHYTRKMQEKGTLDRECTGECSTLLSELHVYFYNGITSIAGMLSRHDFGCNKWEAK